MPQLGPLEILVILVVALMVFGPARLPQIGRQVGAGIRELRRFQQSVRDQLDDTLDEEPPRALRRTTDVDDADGGSAATRSADPSAQATVDPSP